MQERKVLTIDLRWIDRSGVGTYIKGMMPGLVERLGDVQIVGIGDPTRLQSFAWAGAGNVRFVECRAEPYSIGEQLKLPLVIPSGTDLFFSPYYTIPLLYRGRLAVTVHDMSHRVVDEIVSNPKKRIYAKTMYAAIRKRASLIFTVSEFSKSELLRLTAGPRNNIVATHLGVNQEWYSAGDQPRIRTGPYFVCVGNIKPYKNVPRLVEAFLSVQDLIPQELVIVGQSEGLITGESPEFFERVRNSKGRVHMTGFVSPEQLLSLVGHADALIMPSTYEGFGLPPLEAMAAGVPAVVANAASLPEVCGDAALYFDPYRVEDIAEKLVAIASDRPMRDELKRKGLLRSRQYSWDQCSEKMAQALQGVLASPERRGA